MSFIVLVSSILFGINSHANAAEVCRESARRATRMGRLEERDQILERDFRGQDVGRTDQIAAVGRTAQQVHDSGYGANGESGNQQSSPALTRIVGN